MKIKYRIKIILQAITSNHVVMLSLSSEELLERMQGNEIDFRIRYYGLNRHHAFSILSDVADSIPFEEKVVAEMEDDADLNDFKDKKDKESL